MTRHVLRAVLTALVGASLCVASPAAAVDLTGTYLMRVGSGAAYCLLSLTQSGTDLSVSHSAAAG